MVDLYQTGIVITFILVISGSMFGVLSAIDIADDGVDFGITNSINSTSITGSTSDLNTMMTELNNDFNAATSSSNLVTQTILGGGVLIKGTIIVAQLIISAFTSWIAIVDVLFGFAVGTPIIALAIPIKVILSIIIIYTIIKFVGDIIKHLPFFGG